MGLLVSLLLPMIAYFFYLLGGLVLDLIRSVFQIERNGAREGGVSGRGANR